jgi:hypothetical protein
MVAEIRGLFKVLSVIDPSIKIFWAVKKLAAKRQVVRNNIFILFVWLIKY